VGALVLVDVGLSPVYLEQIHVSEEGHGDECNPPGFLAAELAQIAQVCECLHQLFDACCLNVEPQPLLLVETVDSVVDAVAVHADHPLLTGYLILIKFVKE